MIERLRIEARFCGPPGVGNGGYVAGRLARHLEGAVEVTLRAPTPLEKYLEIHAGSEGGVELRDGEQRLADAKPIELDLDVPAAPEYQAAERVAGTCRAFETHPFPECFACGPARRADGLGVFPGPLPELGIVAAPWRPDASLGDASGRVDDAFLWAALDCTSSFPLLEDPAAQALEPMVLGRLSVRIEGVLRTGEHAIVIAWPLGIDGRRGHSGCAVFRASGERVACARATWFSLAGR